MAALDKLINLLEQVKETNPDFTAKAEKALDVLVGEDIEEEQEIVEEEIEEEPFDDSYIEINSDDLQKVVELQKATTALVTSLGLLTQNYEVDKEECLDNMEKTQKSLQALMEEMKDRYNLDKVANYSLVFPHENQANPGTAAFVKQ